MGIDGAELREQRRLMPRDLKAPILRRIWWGFVPTVVGLALSLAWASLQSREPAALAEVASPSPEAQAASGAEPGSREEIDATAGSLSSPSGTLITGPAGAKRPVRLGAGEAFAAVAVPLPAPPATSGAVAPGRRASDGGPGWLGSAVFGLLGGLLIGIALMTLRHFSDPRIYTARQLRAALNVPVLGTIPEIESPAGATHAQRSWLQAWWLGRRALGT